MPEKFKSAFVAVIGRPSAGKSTLINQICGYKLAIVSPVPQTTRNIIRGIKTSAAYQFVFLDTPGLHDSEKAINLKLRDAALQTLSDSDLVLYVVDSTRAPGPEEESIISKLAPFKSKTFIAINKSDAKSSDVAGTKEFLTEKLPGIKQFVISALKGEGIDSVLLALEEAAPEGPAYYPEDIYSDQEPVFRIAEIIREKVFLNTKDELPHAVYVEYTSHHKLDDGSLVYEGNLVTERESQKGILIGAKGSMIRRIREEAEQDLEEVFGYPVRLSLKVKVNANWKKDKQLLKRILG